MKLTLVIFVGIGLHLCAVSAMWTESSSGGESSRPLVPSNDKGKRPFTRKISNLFKKGGSSKEFDTFASGVDPISFYFDKNDPGFEEYKQYKEYLENQRIQHSVESYGNFQNYQVKQKFAALIGMFKTRYMVQLPWDKLESADQEFKKACITNFETGSGFDVNDKNLQTKCPNYDAHAYRAVTGQVQNFLSNFKNCLSNFKNRRINDVMASLSGSQPTTNSLAFIQLWFTIDWNGTTLQSGKKNDDAAKVIYILQKYEQFMGVGKLC